MARRATASPGHETTTRTLQNCAHRCKSSMCRVANTHRLADDRNRTLPRHTLSLKSCTSARFVSVTLRNLSAAGDNRAPAPRIDRFALAAAPERPRRLERASSNPTALRTPVGGAGRRCHLRATWSFRPDCGSTKSRRACNFPSFCMGFGRQPCWIRLRRVVPAEVASRHRGPWRSSQPLRSPRRCCCCDGRSIRCSRTRRRSWCC